jgi:hypothetical protein
MTRPVPAMSVTYLVPKRRPVTERYGRVEVEFVEDATNTGALVVARKLQTPEIVSVVELRVMPEFV